MSSFTENVTAILTLHENICLENTLLKVTVLSPHHISSILNCDFFFGFVAVAEVVAVVVGTTLALSVMVSLMTAS